MNTPNNKRRKLSQEKIEKTFVELIQTKEISVSDICKKANLNRTTFYSNYIDIYDLVDKINEKMFNDFFNIYTKEREEKKHSYDFLKLFKHIKENQIFYKTYFKLNLDSKEFPKFVASPSVKCMEQKSYFFLKQLLQISASTISRRLLPIQFSSGFFFRLSPGYTIASTSAFGKYSWSFTSRGSILDLSWKRSTLLTTTS